MICIVLAAGYATRMYPLTENFPKPLLEVKGKPIINWLLDDIDQIAGMDQLVVVTNHKFIDRFKEWETKQSFRAPLLLLDDGSTENTNRLGAVKDIQIAFEAVDGGNVTAGGSTDAAGIGSDAAAGGADTAGGNADALVVAGDNLLDFSFTSFVTYYHRVGVSCIMCHEEPDLSKCRRTGIITLDKAARVTSFEEKPDNPKSNLAVPPFYLYTRKDLELIPSALASGCNADAPGGLAAWLSHNSTVYAFQMPGKRYDIGSIEGYDRIKETYRGIIDGKRR